MDIKYRYGWICPKCGKVHSPDVLTCDCTIDYTQPPLYNWDWSAGQLYQNGVTQNIPYGDTLK